MYDSSTEMCDNYYFCINFLLVFFFCIYMMTLCITLFPNSLLTCTHHSQPVAIRVQFFGPISSCTIRSTIDLFFFFFFFFVHVHHNMTLYVQTCCTSIYIIIIIIIIIHYGCIHKHNDIHE